MIKDDELTCNKIYDDLSQSYDLRIDETYTQFLKYYLLKRFTKNNEKCLHIGIANGIFSIPISSQVKEIHGIDINLKMLEQCKNNLADRNIKNIYLYHRSATNLLFEDSAFDIVYSFSTLLLVNNIERALKEIVRVLKSDGLAILDITGKRNLSQLYWNKFYQQHGHWGIHAFNLHEIESKFNGLGFKIIERHSTGLLDQWKYIFGLRWIGNLFFEKLFHRTYKVPDIDYKVSQRFPHFANRWYFVLKKIRVF